ncbi:MAG: hypothetical protein H8E84_02655 [Flavobacteriales bacterium]|nr:hypothetical protein [Flavobacteriales bacterium]
MKIRILTVGLLLFFACQKEDDFIQNVMVDYNLNLSLPLFSDLQTVGNYVFIANEGVKGIIVYRQDFNLYKTYDRNCSYEPSLTCARIDSVNSSIAICNCCNSKFLLNQNGDAIDGPAILPLKEYSNNLSGDFLYIYN